MKKIVTLAFVAWTLGAALAAEEIRCEGEYPWHPQGVATDGTSIYWTFTTVLVKTDLKGKVLATDEIARTGAGHMGDLCCHGGRVYVGMNMGLSQGVRVGDEVWEYDAATLRKLRSYPTPEATFCNNGLEWSDGFFWVVTSAPKHCRYNQVFVYTSDFRYCTCRFIDSGWTNLGVQTICRAGDRMLFGCYGSPKDPEMPHPSCTLVVEAKDLLPKGCHPESPSLVPCRQRLPVNTAEGLLVLDDRVWEAHGICLSMSDDRKVQRWTARLMPSAVK